VDLNDRIILGFNILDELIQFLKGISFSELLHAFQLSIHKSNMEKLRKKERLSERYCLHYKIKKPCKSMTYKTSSALD